MQTYSYDAFGQLVVVDYSSTGEVEVLHWDGNRIIGASELNSRAPLWDAVFSPTHQDKLLEFYHHEVGEAQVPLTDHRNSVVGVWNAGQGAMGELARYDAEGLVTLLSSAEEPLCDEHDTLETVCPTPGPGGLLPFGFNSQFRSRGTGLVYMRNRWYSPRLAQFVSHDPLEYVDSSNLYAFAAFDPINKWDPFGLDAAQLAREKAEAERVARELDAAVARGNALQDGIEFSIDAVIQKTVLAADDIAVDIGNANREFTRRLKDGNRPKPDDSDFETIQKATRAAAIAVYEASTPQSGEDVWGEVIVMAATAGAGKLANPIKKAADDVGGWAGRLFRKCSFTAGTVVLMCDGSYQPIETVKEGDQVLARDGETGEVSCQQVVDPYANPRRSIILLELRSGDGTTEVIETTDNHPFFVADRGWSRVDELAIGDQVPSADGSLLTVVGATWTDRIETVYNFGVEDFHTYFVGERGAWVHNCISRTVDEAITAGLLRSGGGTERILRSVEARFRATKPATQADAMNALGDGAQDVGMGVGFLDWRPGADAVYTHGGGGLQTTIRSDGTTVVERLTDEGSDLLWRYEP